MQAFRGALLHFLGDPDELGASAHEYFDDGLLVLHDGKVAAAGAAHALLPGLPEGVELADYSGKLIMPGFVDTHVHYAQTDIIAAYGEQLLEWLERYTFPVERRFADPEYAREVADFFLAELLRNGTTTALVFATVHPQSVDAFFTAAQARGLRMIAGKVLMDRNCPEFLCDTADSAYADSKALIEKWHGKDRLLYAVTPRFAPTSTERQLELAGRLLDEHPGVYLQSHCIHLDSTDRERMGETGAAMSFCPTSNLFLGSGLFDADAAKRHNVRVGIGTDVGGGTSLSMLRTLDEAYKVTQLGGQRLSPLRAFYLATLGSARSLYLDDRIGNFVAGKEGDFIVLDLAATPLMARRMASTGDLVERLFVLMMLGDDRAVFATHIMGRRESARSPC